MFPYGKSTNVDISDVLVSKIVEKIIPEITAWQNRPLEPVYPFVFMDAIYYNVNYYCEAKSAMEYELTINQQIHRSIF